MELSSVLDDGIYFFYAIGSKASVENAWASGIGRNFGKVLKVGTSHMACLGPQGLVGV